MVTCFREWGAEVGWKEKRGEKEKRGREKGVKEKDFSYRNNMFIPKGPHHAFMTLRAGRGIKKLPCFG